MRAAFEAWTDWPSSPVTEALAAVRQVGALSTRSPVVLGVAPPARMNAFQSLIYRRFPEHGFAVTPVARPERFTRLADLAHRYPVATHLHWLSFVLEGCATRAEARARLDEFEEDLGRYLARGGRVVWTVHNRLPHDARFPDLEVHVRRLVSRAAAVVHVMTEATLPAVADSTDIDPATVVLAPHPTYRDAYPDHVSRGEARAALGIEPDEHVLVLLGAIKAYKGIDGLLEAFDAAQRTTRRRLRLVVAGTPDDSRETQDFVERCLVHPGVLVMAERVRTELVQYFLRAADVGVAPYARTLNSGAVMLYTTFDLPVVVPDDPSIGEYVAPDAHVAFGEAAGRSLEDALVASLDLTGPDVRATVRAWADRFDAAAISETLAVRLRAALAPEG